VYCNIYITIAITGAVNADSKIYYLSGNWNGIPYEISVRVLCSLGLPSNIPQDDKHRIPHFLELGCSGTVSLITCHSLHERRDCIGMHQELHVRVQKAHTLQQSLVREKKKVDGRI
jgi:hypothetical protein